jgi:hypothetical protein
MQPPEETGTNDLTKMMSERYIQKISLKIWMSSQDGVQFSLQYAGLVHK